MKRGTIFATTLLMLGAFGPANAEVLTGTELRKAVSGKTVYLRTQGIELPISYRANGTMSGRLKAFVAALAGGAKTQDTGKWWITKGQLCQRWNSWLDRRSYCYTLRRAGSTVHWRRNDGRSGTARISG